MKWYIDRGQSNYRQLRIVGLFDGNLLRSKLRKLKNSLNRIHHVSTVLVLVKDDVSDDILKRIWKVTILTEFTFFIIIQSFRDGFYITINDLNKELRIKIFDDINQHKMFTQDFNRIEPLVKEFFRRLDEVL